MNERECTSCLVSWLMNERECTSCLVSWLMILMGFRYLSSSIPLISLTGVAIGVGVIFAFLIFSICRNPSISNTLVRWAFIGFSLVEVSGFIGLVYSFPISHAFTTATSIIGY